MKSLSVAAVKFFAESKREREMMYEHINKSDELVKCVSVSMATDFLMLLG